MSDTIKVPILKRKYQFVEEKMIEVLDNAARISNESAEKCMGYDPLACQHHLNVSRKALDAISELRVRIFRRDNKRFDAAIQEAIDRSELTPWNVVLA